MSINNPLESIFSSRSVLQLLTVFLMNPDDSFYQQELVRRTGGNLRPIQLALEKLFSAGLVSIRRDGRQVYYSAVKENPAFASLQVLFLRTFALADVLRAALEPLADSIDIAFVYGSIASGEIRAQSDVDVFVVSTATRQTLSRALGEAEDTLGREINVTPYSSDLFASEIAAANPFILNVLSGPKLWLVGDELELERLAR